MRGQIKGRLLLSEGEKATLAEIAQRLGRKALEGLAALEKQHRIMGFAIIGFFNKALELSGANDAIIYFATPIEEGRGYAELSIAWS